MWIGFFYPKYALAFYVLFSTKFLGFFDAETTFVFGGIGIATPVLNLILLLNIFLKKQWYMITGKYKAFSIVILLLLLYGVLSPFLYGYESLFQSITASKELWCVFFFLYIVANRNKISIKFILKLLSFVGLYLAVIYIFYVIFKRYPPTYYIDGHFRVYYPTYMSLALFFVYCKWLSNQIKTLWFLFVSVILVLGLIFAGHFALTFSTIFILIFFHIVLRGNNLYSFGTLVKSLLMFLFLGYAVVISPRVSGQINAIVTGEDIAIASRDIYNKFRWKAINDSPIFGYGFIHKSSGLTDDYILAGKHRYTERFEVIDSGYVDILIKFGFLGLIIILITWMKPVYNILKHSRLKSPLEVVCSLFLLQYVFVCYTWSVFTFSHGLIPGFLIIFIIFLISEYRAFQKKNISIYGK